MILFLIFAILTTFREVLSSSNLEVKTTSGIVFGKQVTVLDQYINQFLGIPYARPPLKNLRFRPPVSFRDEKAEIQATNFKSSCLQPAHVSSVISPLLSPNTVDFDEDCLYLNIFSPKQMQKESLPVMIWLTGEGFDFADPSQFDLSYLAIEGQVIVVSVNYRLSVLGFLSALNDQAPGNVGLLDQRAAFKWVKENIANFGGNPNSITLFGRFTGSMSIAIHAFSPLNSKQTLFERVILQSGIPVGDWVFNREPLNATYDLGKMTNCFFEDISDIIDCLKRVPAEILLNEALNLKTKFRPIIDFHLIYEDTLKAVSSSKKISTDIMIGTNNNEGTLCTTALKAMQSPVYNEILQNLINETEFNKLVEINLGPFYSTHNSFINLLTAYKYKSTKKSLRDDFMKFCSDLLITSHAQKFVDEVVKKEANAFMYEFSHRPSFSIHPSFVKAGHGDDVLFTLGLPLKLQDLSPNEVHLTRLMVQAFSNFARTGNPNPLGTVDWPKYTEENPQIINFNAEDIRSSKAVYKDACTFFHIIVPASQQKSCPIKEQLNETKMTVRPIVEYIIYCILGILFLILCLAVILILKIKKDILFQRLI